MVERALPVWGRKVALLPDRGVLLVATDLQGNLEDLRRLIALLDAEVDRGAILALCGDLVHGPSPDMNAPGAWPEHLGTPYRDRSAELLRAFESLTRRRRIFALLGNHEHAHIGGPVVPKFYPDEAAVLDEALGEDRARAHDFLRSFPLIAVAPCGVVLTHGAPRATEPTLEAFEALDYRGYDAVSIDAMYDRGTLGALLWARGASERQALDLLQVALGRRSGVVAYGHDVVREGYDKADRHQICVSTSFGLLDCDKTYLRLDLSARYDTVDDLGEGVEILPLYPGGEEPSAIGTISREAPK